VVSTDGEEVSTDGEEVSTEVEEVSTEVEEVSTDEVISTPKPVTTLPVVEGRSFIMVPSNLTCQAGCEQHNMFCVDDLTKASDIDLDLCYNGLVASGYGVDTPLTKGGINNSVLAPGGCYAEMYSVVHLNSNSFGFDFGCHGSVVDNPMAQRVCVCL